MASETVLVSVFEPFGGTAVNASQAVGTALAQAANDEDRLSLLTLPVVHGDAEARLLAAFEKRPAPLFAIALGEAGPEPVVRLEKVAINYDDFRIPDNGGNQPRDAPIREDGPPAYFATLPLGEIARRLEGKTPLPVRVSLSAGAFLCNHIAYEALHFLAENPVCPFLFVHVPAWRPDKDDSRDDLGYSFDDLTNTVEAVIKTARSLVGV